MDKLTIPEKSQAESITLRLPKKDMEIIDVLSNLKNTTKNQIVIRLLEYSIENLDKEEKQDINEYLANIN